MGRNYTINQASVKCALFCYYFWNLGTAILWDLHPARQPLHDILDNAVTF